MREVIEYVVKKIQTLEREYVDSPLFFTMKWSCLASTLALILTSLCFYYFAICDQQNVYLFIH